MLDTTSFQVWWTMRWSEIFKPMCARARSGVWSQDWGVRAAHTPASLASIGERIPFRSVLADSKG